MGVDKPAFLEKAMDSVCRHRPHPEHSVKGIRPGAQVGDGAQELEGMAFFLKRVISGGSAFDLNRGCPQLTRLLSLRGQDQLPADAQGGADVLAGDLLEIGERLPLRDDLQVALAASIVELDEGESLGLAQGSHPSADGERLSREGFGVGVDRRDFMTFHG